jgi:L-seryl-tRNA(Ser) seleniumtransferase
MRALRVDKLTYAALEATLEEYAAGRAGETVPVARMLGLTTADIGPRADALAELLAAAGWHATVVDGMSTIGGGSAPGSTLPTRLVALRHPSMAASMLLQRLRQADPPIIARIEADLVLLDLRTIDPAEDQILSAGIGRTP